MFIDLNVVEETAKRYDLHEVDVFVYAHYFDGNMERTVNCNRIQAVSDLTAYVNRGVISEHVRKFCIAVKHDRVTPYMLGCIIRLESVF
jgi:hypothetical protein